MAETPPSSAPSLSALPVGTVLAASGPALAPSQRLHLLVLGVTDIARSAAFFDALSWRRSPTGHDGFVKYDLGGYALCLLPLDALAADVGAKPELPSFRGLFFVYLARSVEEVARILAKAVEAGGTLVKPATRTPWGVAGFFADPDGNLFEVDYETVWVLDDENRLVVDQLNP